jgi:tartrate-resistant acid phosphatase type 5
MRAIYLGFVILSITLFSCKGVDQDRTPEYYEQIQFTGLDTPKNALSFFVIGDWGRKGSSQQQNVANKMADVAYKIKPEFIISTGDNFYENGVLSINDPLWQSSFEKVYRHETLFKPWYVVLGNHDYRSNPQAEIDYTRHSQRWNMPSRYYSFEKALKDGSGEKVLFVFIDTSPFEKSYRGNKRHQPVWDQDTVKQRRWLEHILDTSKASWKIVIGHHPLYTTGDRYGSKNDMIAAFQPIFEKYKVDAYFAGHEHDLQYQKPDNVYTNHIISGAGSETRPIKTRLKTTRFAEAVPGFMSVSLNRKSLLLQAITDKRQVIYKTTIHKGF